MTEEEEKSSVRGISISIGSGGVQAAISSRDDDEDMDYLIKKLKELINEYR